MSLRRSLLILLTGCIILTLQTPARAETASGLRGIVVDKDGAPIPGATVNVTNSTLGISPMGAVTDAKGEFRIVPLPPGRSYVVEVAFPTMARIKLDLEVASGRITPVQ